MSVPVGLFRYLAGVPENIAADIVGHNKRTMTYGLYSGGTSTQQKYDAINKVQY